MSGCVVWPMTAELQTRAGSSSPIRRDRAGIDSIRRHLPGSGSAGHDLPVERQLSMRIQLRIIAGDIKVISGDEIARFDKRPGRSEMVGFSFVEVRTALARIQERLITVRTRFAAFPENQLLHGRLRQISRQNPSKPQWLVSHGCGRATTSGGLARDLAEPPSGC
jgi:hypothetical protein